MKYLQITVISSLVLFYSIQTLAQKAKFKMVEQFEIPETYDISPGQLSKEGGNFYIGLVHQEEGSDVYVMDRLANAKFSSPKKLGNICSYLSDCYQVSASRGGSTIVFVNSDTDDWYGNELYITDRNDGVYSPARKLDEVNDASLADAYPWISSDGLRLYFVRDNRIFKSSRKAKGTPFEESESVAIESWDADILSFWLGTDEKEIFLLSDNEIWSARKHKKSATFKKPQLFTDEFKNLDFITGISMTPDKKELIFFLSDENEVESIRRYSLK